MTGLWKGRRFPGPAAGEQRVVERATWREEVNATEKCRKDSERSSGGGEGLATDGQMWG